MKVTVTLDPESSTAYPADPALVTASYSVVYEGTTFLNAVFDWGDGSPVETVVGSFRQHQYTLAGVYQVSVTVTDSLGLQATATRLARVYRESVALPAIPSEIPARKQHVPLDSRRPYFVVRRPDGTNIQ